MNFIPIVVFSVNADLKVKTTSAVVYTTRLLRTIKEYNIENISDQVKNAAYAKILAQNINNKEIRKEHVKTIHKNIANVQEKIKKDICPKCGGQLVIRNGKYGKFKGCSNYPRCRFIEKK